MLLARDPFGSHFPPVLHLRRFLLVGVFVPFDTGCVCPISLTWLEDDVPPSASCLRCLPFLQAKEDGFAPGLPIVTPSDPASAHWTAVRPSSQVVQRLVALAKRSLTCIQVDPTWLTILL